MNKQYAYIMPNIVQVWALLSFEMFFFSLCGLKHIVWETEFYSNVASPVSKNP